MVELVKTRGEEDPIESSASFVVPSVLDSALRRLPGEVPCWSTGKN